MSRYRQTMSEALKQVYKEQDEKDHEISMARGELEAIADKATQLAGALQGKSDEGNPLEAWVQTKITKAKDYINSVSDYLMYNPDMKQNEELEENINKYAKLYSPEAIKIAKKFISQYNIKDDLDIQLTAELIDNYLKQFKLLRKPVNYEFIRNNLAKSFKQA